MVSPCWLEYPLGSFAIISSFGFRCRSSPSSTWRSDRLEPGHRRGWSLSPAFYVSYSCSPGVHGEWAERIRQSYRLAFSGDR